MSSWSLLRMRRSPFGGTGHRFLVSSLALAAGILCPSPSQATLISVSASVNISAPSSADSSDFLMSTDRDAVLPVAVDATADNFLPFDTVVSGSASASASSTSLGVSGNLTMSAFDPAVVGNEANVYASGFYRDEFSVSGMDAFYLSPIFDVTGSLAASAGVPASLSVAQTFFSSTSGFHENVIYQAIPPADGSTATIDARATPIAYAVTPADFIEIGVRLTAAIDVRYDLLAPGDYSASIDFSHTLQFLGFMAWADAAMTTPITSGLSIASRDGTVSFPLLDPNAPTPGVPEPGTLGLLSSGLLWLGLWRARARKPLLRSPHR